MPWMYKYDSPTNGDSGSMSMLLRGNPETGEIERKSGRPEIGWAVRVGTFGSRSYHHQDWWQTSYIEKILEETENRTVFLTATGSKYFWYAEHPSREEIKEIFPSRYSEN